MSDTDTILLNRWHTRRDAAAFQELISRHAAMVHGTCKRILRNAADAEEVSQECFLVLARGDHRNVRLLGGWLHRLATHRSLDRLRTDERRRRREHRYAAKAPTHAEPTWNDIQDFVDEAVAALPERLNRVVVGHFLEGRTQADLARSLAVSPSAVSRRIDAAVRRIRKALRSKGVIVSVAALPALLTEAAGETMPAALAASLGKIALSGGTGAPAATSAAAAGAATSLTMKVVLPVLTLSAVLGVGVLVAVQIQTSSPNRTASAPQQPPAASAPPARATETESSANEEANRAAPETHKGLSVPGVAINVEDGSRVPGVKVTFVGWPRHDRHEAETDTEGRFAMAGLKPGKYVAEAEHATLVLCGEDRKFDVPVGEETAEIVLKMGTGATIGGRIYDAETGDGIAGERIIAGTEYEMPVGWLGPRTETDADGRYLFTKLEPGEYTIVRYGWARGYPRPSSRLGLQEKRTISVKIGETRDDVDVALQRGICISGVVYDSSRRPVEGAVVSTILYAERKSFGRSSTDEHGVFIVAGIEPGGPHRVIVSKKGLATEKLSGLQVGPEGLSGLEIVLRPEATVEGTLVTPDGEPVPDALVKFEGVNGEASCSDDTDKEGRFVATGLQPGDYNVTARRRTPDSPQAIPVGGAPPALHVAEGQHLTGLRFILQTAKDVGLPISGHVTDSAGQPIGKVYLKFWRDPDEGQPSATSTTFSDASGAYTVYVTAAGTYSAATNKRGYTSLVRKGIAAGSTSANFTLRGTGSVPIRVVDGRTREPITRFACTYTHDVQFPVAHSDTPATDHPGGLLKLNEIEERPLLVRVRADGYRTAIRTIEGVRAGETLPETEIALQSGGEIACVVLDPTGAPLPDAQVRMFRPGEGTGYAPLELAIGDDGRFHGQSLLDETLVVHADHARFAPAYTMVQPGNSPLHVQLTLPEGGTIEGSVTIDGAPAPYREVSIAYLDESAAKYATTTDGNGRYRLGLLPEGSAVVAVSFPETEVQASGNEFTADIRNAAATTVAFDIATSRAP